MHFLQPIGMYLLKRLIVIVLITVGYFTVIRPIRAELTKKWTAGISLEEPYQIVPRVTGFLITQPGWSDSKMLKMQIPFGMFFLFSCIGLVGIAADRTCFLKMTVLHFALWLSAFICFLIGYYGYPMAFRLMDMFMSYLVPTLTLGYVPFIYLEHRNKHTSLNEENT